jgi:hypothetical protein
MEDPLKTKNRTIYDVAIPLLSIYPKEYQDTIETPVLPCLLQHYSQ